MKKQLNFIETLFADFDEDCKEHIKKIEIAKTTTKYSSGYWSSLQTSDTCKTALKRKIVMLRRELLNLSKQIDQE